MNRLHPRSQPKSTSFNPDMNWNRTRSARSAQRQRPQSALERIDAFLERTNEGSNAELIRSLRKAMFADVDELEASGEIKLPK